MKLRTNNRLNPLSFFGLAFLAFASTTRIVLERQHVSEHLTDPIAGALYGIAIASLLIGIWRQTHPNSGNQHC